MKILNKLLCTLTLALFAFTANAQEVLLENGKYTIYRVEKENDRYLLYSGEMLGVGMYSLYSFLAKNPDIDKVSFHSSGGPWISYKAGKMLHKSNPDLKVLVKRGNWCLSACAAVLSRFENGEIEPGAVFAFHTPFVPMIPTNRPLQTYADKVSASVAKMAEEMMESGYSMKLVTLITETTSSDKYLAFDSFESLQSWRHIGLLETPSNPIGYSHRVISNIEIHEMMGKGRLEE